MKHAQVITNKKVAVTFNSEECLLRRTLTKLEKTNGVRRYTITTDYVNYVDGELVSLGLAKETKPAYNATVADAMFEQIRNLIDFSKPFSEIMFQVEQLSLLGGTQQDLPLGTKPEDWEIYNI